MAKYAKKLARKARSPARNQHYVPRVLLRNFATAGRGKSRQVHVFDKSDGRRFQTSIENVFAARDFNTLTLGDDVVCLEDAMGQIEGAVAGVLKKVLDERSLAGLRPNEIEALDSFTALQKVRNVSVRADITHLGELMRELVRNEGTDPKTVPQLGEQDGPELAKAVALQLTDNLDEFARSLAGKQRLLMESHGNDVFVLGDSGSVWTNARDTGPYGNLGLEVLGIQIYLPLSPDLLLAYFCPSIIDNLRSEHDAQLKAAKVAQILSVLGTGEMGASAYHERDALVQAAQRSGDFLTRFDAGLPIACEAKDVDAHNMLQIQQSERFVVSNRSDFTLAERMITEDPRFRIGLRSTIN